MLQRVGVRNNMIVGNESGFRFRFFIEQVVRKMLVSYNCCISFNNIKQLNDKSFEKMLLCNDNDYH